MVAIRGLYPEATGTRVILIDDKSDGLLYNPINDATVEIPNFSPSTQGVLWENHPNDRVSLFLAVYSSFYMYLVFINVVIYLLIYLYISSIIYLFYLYAFLFTHLPIDLLLYILTYCLFVDVNNSTTQLLYLVYCVHLFI